MIGDDQDLMPMDLDDDNVFAAPMDRHNSASDKDFPNNRNRDEEEKFQSDEMISYFDKCKRVGRVGPIETKLDKKSSYGEIIFAGRDDLDVEAMGSFCSIRATTGVFSGRYYYEVTLKSCGLMQIGWCTLQTIYNS